MTAPQTWTVNQRTLMLVFLSGYKSGMATAVANRHNFDALKSIQTDADAMKFGKHAAHQLDHDHAGHAAAWRAILAVLSGVDAPMAVIEAKRGPGA